jgi:hypothetical protein
MSAETDRERVKASIARGAATRADVIWRFQDNPALPDWVRAMTATVNELGASVEQLQLGQMRLMELVSALCELLAQDDGED